MKISSGSLSSPPEIQRTELETTQARVKNNQFNAKIESSVSPTRTVNQVNVSEEILNLARRVAAGELGQAETSRAFVEMVVAQNGGKQTYGQIADRITDSVGTTVAEDPYSSAQLYQNLIKLAKQANK